MYIKHVHLKFCAHLIICLGVLNVDIIRFTPPMKCLPCISISKRFDSFIFKLCIMIVNTLKMYTGVAGRKQSLALSYIIITTLNYT